MSNPVVPDSTFTTTQVSAWATQLGCTTSDAQADLNLDSSNNPTDTSDQSKKNRNRAKAILILMGF